MGEMVQKARTVTLYVALTALAATTLATIGASDAEAFPGGNGLIVFDDGRGIWARNPDGSGNYRIVDQAQEPSLSGDGQMVAYTDTSSSDFFIYTIDVEGNNPKTQVTTIATGGSDFDPTFSPDGEWIAFRRRVVYEVLLEAADNTDPHATVITEDDEDPAAAGVVVGMIVANATTNKSAVVTAVDANSITTTPIEDLWSEGDGYLVYHEQDRIYKIRPNGADETKLSTADVEDVYSDYAPDWSPDGSSIVFATKRNGADDIYVMDADGEGVSSVNLTGDEPKVAWDPTWSPDGTRIAYSSANADPGESAENIWTMDADGTDKAILVNSGNAGKDEHPSWSPDGAMIVFERTVSLETTLYIVPAAGGSATQFVSSPSRSPDWQAGVVGVVDAYNVYKGATLGPAGTGVLANDLFPVSTPGTKSAVKLTDPVHGALTFNSDGTFAYVHDDTDTVSDSFTYQPVQDGVAGTATTVNITINRIHKVALVDPTQGLWYLYDNSGALEDSFFFGNPGDFPFMGDWDCDGVETPGMYRQSDGFVYLRNTNTQGFADIKFFFGNPGDVPVAGDFNNDGCGTVSIYRPSNQTFYIINKLGENNGGLGAAEFSYVFGNPGDKPFVGDFDGDGVETVGLDRESTGLVYFRNSHTQGNADSQFIFGDPGDRLIAGDWNDDGKFSPALFRPSNTTMYFRYTNTQGNADAQFVPIPNGSTWLPVSGTR